MQEKIDIVIQGALMDNTINTATYYSQLDFVDNIVVSTWESEREKLQNIPELDKVKFVFSKLPTHDGGGNVNYQIISSKNGISECSNNVVVKMRSDQTIVLDDMRMLDRFYNKFREGDEMFVLGMGTHHPYHPQDHVFWGPRKSLEKLFECPLSTWPSYHNPNFSTTHYRAPMYLGAYYYSTLSDTAKYHFDNPKDYLFDGASKRNEAFEEYYKIQGKGFKVFPRVRMDWHKYRQGYMYDFYAAQGEVYYDDKWE